MNYEVILRQHVEDAALHWVAFEETCTTQPPDHPDIRFYGKRLEPHLKGLALAIEEAWPLAMEVVLENPGEADAVFVAMWLAIRAANAARIGQVAQVVEAFRDVAPGAMGAVHWITVSQLAPFVRDWTHHENPVLRAMALRSCLLHGSLPAHLKSDLRHASSMVRGEAIALCAERAPELFQEALPDCLADTLPQNRLRAALAAAKGGHRAAALQTLVDLAQTEGEIAEAARDWAASIMTPDELAEWVKKVREDESLITRLVGLAGNETYWPWLIEKMQDPEVAVVSGLAARDLCGQDLFAGGLYYDEAADLPEPLTALDPDAVDVPNADQFRIALQDGALDRPPDFDVLSARAQMLNGMRTLAGNWSRQHANAR